MQGSMVFFRGSGASARAYLEADHHRADEYYLEEQGQLAERFVYGPDGVLVSTDSLDADKYQAWVDWVDPDTGEGRGKPKGQERLNQDDGSLRKRPASPRFAEMTVNCDKSLSVAAALDERVSAALDEAQNQAAQAMNEFVAKNSYTRVGPLGAQRLVAVERMEAAAIIHKTSRAGDPHRHIHVQWNSRVFAEGKWRGVWTTPLLKQSHVLNGIGESVIRGHVGLQAALKEAGFTFDAQSGKVVELHAHAQLLSKRRQQVQANLATIETQWRKDHDGREPTKEERKRFDFQAWALDRPKKQHKQHHASVQGWVAELQSAGLQTNNFTGGTKEELKSLDDLDRAQIAAEAIARCEEKSSAWSLHDLQAKIANQVAEAGVIASQEQINSFVEGTAEQAQESCRSISDPRDGHMPDHVRHMTSERVIAVEDELRHRFAARAAVNAPLTLDGAGFAGTNLAHAQRQAAQLIASSSALGVVEGAAGSGKTTLLKEAKAVLDSQGRQLVVLSPTLMGAQEAAKSLQAPAFGVHKLLHEHGFRWDTNNRFTRLKPGETDPTTGRQYQGPKNDYRLVPGARVVVDEAGMIDQDTALALTQLADQYGCGLVFMGDRAQLPAVGRGGVLDKASKITLDRVDVDVVHRFTDKAYAELSLQLRNREKPAELFDKLYAGGHVRIHDSIEAGVEVMTERAAQIIYTGGTVALGTPTNEGAAEINRHMQQVMAAAGRTREAKHEVVERDGITLMHGDVIMTRNNDTRLGVANRETYLVKNTHRDGSITIITAAGAKESIRLPAAYVAEHVHLGYASTEYGEQGATETAGANLLSEASSPGGLYVGLTRGKEENTLHIAASSYNDAKSQFVDAMHRDNGDLGIEKARTDLAREIEGLDLSTPPIPATVPEHLTQPAPAPGHDQEPAPVPGSVPEPSLMPAGLRQANTQAEPATAPVAASARGPYALEEPYNQLVRENRLASEQRRYERKLASFENRRARYETDHGHSPEAWKPLYDQARADHEKAQRMLSVIEANVQDRAEQTYRTEHVTAAQRLNTAYQAMGQANMFSKKAATRDYEQARQHYQNAYGTAPTGHVPAEPPKHVIAAVREQALKQDNPDLAKARAIEHNAGQKLAEIKAQKPRWITEDRRPQPPTQGTPAQEAAKDRAYAGRLAQAKRLRNEYRNDVRAASTLHPTQALQRGHDKDR
ncbi:MobF family relaxase [Acaricomes phytoseiuli]|uniref:MobF family relaxase n=1 Tax=Acaricomes phytoseiuli TaxID=291968 RepID=UPI000362AD09|nr:MobF family relaxase [Acaricomes phytoseiuli]